MQIEHELELKCLKKQNKVDLEIIKEQNYKVLQEKEWDHEQVVLQWQKHTEELEKMLQESMGLLQVKSPTADEITEVRFGETGSRVQFMSDIGETPKADYQDSLNIEVLKV